VGAWWHTGDFEKASGGTADGTGGAYLIVEQSLWSPEPDDAESERGLRVFAQFGWADDEVSEAAGQYAAGLALNGPMDFRPADATGVYVSTVNLSGAAGYAEDETAFEVFYKVQVTPFLSVKPDVQYIINPGGDPALDNALVGALRFEADF
jgi:porin